VCCTGSEQALRVAAHDALRCSWRAPHNTAHAVTFTKSNLCLGNVHKSQGGVARCTGLSCSQRRRQHNQCRCVGTVFTSRYVAMIIHTPVPASAHIIPACGKQHQPNVPRFGGCRSQTSGRKKGLFDKHTDMSATITVALHNIASATKEDLEDQRKHACTADSRQCNTPTAERGARWE
jgi:hypothetical protein